MPRFMHLPGLNHLAALAMAALVASLAGCGSSQPEETSPITEAAPATQDVPNPVAIVAAPSAPVVAATPAAGPTLGGDGSEIQLDPLAAADLEAAKMSGELACSFSTGDASPLLYVMGVVASNEPAQGVVKVAGYVERIVAPGGFEGITTDPTFTGQGKTIRIALTGPASGGGDSPPHPATLTYQRADGASRTFDGHWQCGP